MKTNKNFTWMAIFALLLAAIVAFFSCDNGNDTDKDKKDPVLCTCAVKAHLDYDADGNLTACDCGGEDCACTAKNYGEGKTVVPFYKMGEVLDLRMTILVDGLASTYSALSAAGKKMFTDMVEKIYVKEGNADTVGNRTVYDETSKTLILRANTTAGNVDTWMDNKSILTAQ